MLKFAILLLALSKSTAKQDAREVFVSGKSYALLSGLRELPSRLSTACYMSAGFPDDVIGTAFSYSDRRRYNWERFLAKMLRDKATCLVLNEATQALYEDVYIGNGPGIFIRTGHGTIADYYPRLKHLNPSKLSCNENLLRLTLLYYASWPEKTRCLQAITEIAHSKPRVAQCISTNIMKINSRMRGFGDLSGELHKPTPIR